MKRGVGGSPDEARLEQTPYPFHTQVAYQLNSLFIFMMLLLVIVLLRNKYDDDDDDD